MFESCLSCCRIPVRMLTRQRALTHAQWMVILTQPEDDRMSVDTLIYDPWEDTDESDSDSDESVNS